MDKNNDDLLLVFKTRLRWAMAQRSWSARHTSLSAGLSDSAVKKVLANDGWPNGNTVLKLATALNTKPDWLMPGSEHISDEEIAAAKKSSQLLIESRSLKGSEKSDAIERSLKIIDLARDNYEFTIHEDAEIYDEGHGRRPATKDAAIVHLVGYVGGADGFEPFEDSITQILEAPAGTKEGTEAVEIWGDSMAPAFPSGTILFYSQIAHPISFYLGKPVIAELRDGRKLFKFLQKGRKTGLYSLQSGDGTMIEDVKLKTVYPIDMAKY